MLPAVLSLVSLVLLLTAFAAMPPGNPQLLVILVAAFTITAPCGVVASVSVDVVHPALRGAAISMAAVAQNLFGFAVGPLVVGAVSDTYGLRSALAVIPLFCGFAAVFFWLASGHYENDLSRVEAGTPHGAPAHAVGRWDRPVRRITERPTELTGDQAGSRKMSSASSPLKWSGV
ncbi:MFS transporter [Streptomyces sp. NBC_01619]|uniref:MFS transporter n=1 Tax=Streptomyces sp. NBC_01619 TaxID=2975901 RepID=UPI00224E1638|nr:MFS transporter [Streptomyces sp. NBC_01619]MCX4515136.1 MFS transporter [Streptomyces sp. NBC_01619]